MKEIFLIFSLIMIFIAGLIIGSELRRDIMKKENLDNYHAVATYETNSLNEVKIIKIEWKKD